VSEALHRVCSVREARERLVRRASVAGRCVALFVWNERVFAIEDECPHAGGRLSESFCDADGYVTCPEHAWEFHVSDGRRRDDLGGQVECFDVVEQDGSIYVRG
jgi:3-phenylpropionate/trans-cinnamate dioxygenase ferredoxin subunit